MVQAAYSLQLPAPNIDTEGEVFWTPEKFILLIRCTCWGSDTPGYWEVRASCRQLTVGACILPACYSEQHRTQNTWVLRFAWHIRARCVCASCCLCALPSP